MKTAQVGSFGIGLDEMPRRDQADPEVVLNRLRLSGRFSIWDATSNQTIANTVQRLCDSGRLETENEGFPWTKVVKIDGEPISLEREKEV